MERRTLSPKQKEYLHLSPKDKAIKKLREDIGFYEKKLSSAGSSQKALKTRCINTLVLLKSILLTYLNDEPRWEWYKHREKVREDILRSKKYM